MSRRLPGEQPIWKQHGGARKGAGRPPKGTAPRIRKSFTLDPDLAERIVELAEQADRSQADVVNAALAAVVFDVSGSTLEFDD